MNDLTEKYVILSTLNQVLFTQIVPSQTSKKNLYDEKSS